LAIDRIGEKTGSKTSQKTEAIDHAMHSDEISSFPDVVSADALSCPSLYEDGQINTGTILHQKHSNPSQRLKCCDHPLNSPPILAVHSLSLFGQNSTLKLQKSTY